MVYNLNLPKKQVGSPPVTHERWHAVSIVGGPDSCPASLELRAKRYLPHDAPRLPMPACTCPLKCKCVYRHYADRRANPRRASERGRPWRAVVPERRHTHVSEVLRDDPLADIDGEVLPIEKSV